MQNEGNVENNVVTICGKVVQECEFSHEVYAEGFYSFKVAVDRLSDNEDVLPITVSDRLVDYTLLKIGTYVQISGQLRSYNNYDNQKNRLVLTIFARELEILEAESDKNPNQIFLNGYICKPPIHRKTPFGREISDILLAVNRAYNKSDYIPCIVWGRNAKFTSGLSVGDNVKLWGRIQSRKYQKKKEEYIEERVAYEVSVSKIEAEKTDKINQEDESTADK